MAIINHGTLVVQGQVRELLSADTTTIRVDARPIDAALRVLGESRIPLSPRLENGFITISTSHETVPALVQSLVEHRIAVHSVVPQRSLEEYFLKITAESEGTSSDAPAQGTTGKHVQK
jgi:ABC-type multidrug transport system ATPase subunit